MLQKIPFPDGSYIFVGSRSSNCCWHEKAKSWFFVNTKHTFYYCFTKNSITCLGKTKLSKYVEKGQKSQVLNYGSSSNFTDACLGPRNNWHLPGRQEEEKAASKQFWNSHKPFVYDFISQFEPGVIRYSIQGQGQGWFLAYIPSHI